MALEGSQGGGVCQACATLVPLAGTGCRPSGQRPHRNPTGLENVESTRAELVRASPKKATTKVRRGVTQVNGSGRLARAWAYVAHTEASSRSSALLRIGLALIAWTRFGRHMVLMQEATVDGLVRNLAFFLATTAMLVGFKSRLSTALTALVLWLIYYYWGLLHGVDQWKHHHTYLLAMGVTLTAFTPCDRSYSVDRWLSIRAAQREGRPLPDERGNIWGLRLIVLQLSVIYLFAAVDKTNGPFLSGVRMEHYFVWYYAGFDYAPSAWFVSLCQLMAIATVVLEYALALGLPFARTRRYLVLLGLLLHAGFYVLLPVATYSVTMFALYLAYVDPDKVHEFLEDMHGTHGPQKAP